MDTYAVSAPPAASSPRLLVRGFRWCSAWLALAFCLYLAVHLQAHQTHVALLLLTAGTWILRVTFGPGDLLRMVAVMPALVTLLWSVLSWRWPRLTYLVYALMPAHALVCITLTLTYVLVR